MELEAVRHLARCALQNLEAHRRRIDDLNVYPVPDGDTGTNLTLTLRSIVEALDASVADTSEAVAKDVTRAALMGARGNSGVIFSQIVRGFVDVFAQTEDGSTPRFRRAFRGASDAAYRAVKHPVEGTMLTVIREMAEEGERSEHRRLSVPEFLAAVLARGEDALARTPEMLEVLRNAGVVDAGGAGLVEIMRGMVYGASGRSLPEAPVEGETLSFEAIHQELSRYRYCTGFVVEGEGLDQAGLEATLERMGDSLLVVGDETALKVHLHTDDPGAAISAATLLGVVEGVEIANMHHQTAQREDRLLESGGAPVLTLETGLVAVCPGRGNRRLFESLGATRVIEGGQTMNPSAAEIVEAIELVPAAEVLVLPNNANVILTAEQAAEHAGKPVRVVPSRSVQAGLAAMTRYVSTNTPEQNEQDMLEALGSVATGEVTIASRDAQLDGVEIRAGDFLGLVDGTAVATGEDIATVVATVIARLLAGEREWLAILTGEGAPPLENLLVAVERDHPDLVIEVHDGGQPHYPLLVVAE
jgi:DAK2 domain fusion protein YloV